MTYVTEQTPQELRAHMRQLKAMAGWNEPLADRLHKEVLDLDAEVKRLTATLAAQAGQSEPVAWQAREMLDEGWSEWREKKGQDLDSWEKRTARRPDLYEVRLLYTGPAPVRQPLTLKDIQDCSVKAHAACEGKYPPPSWSVEFTRAIEAKITEKGGE